MIHREGYRIVYSSWALFFLALIAVMRLISEQALLWVIPFVLIPIFISRFFRDPRRRLNAQDDDSVLSPCDGKVVSVEKITMDGAAYWNISVFMSVWNVHINWIPISGKITHRKYHPGKYLVAWHPKSSTENERSVLEITTLQSERVKITQIAGAVARRIITYPTNNQEVTQGDELGFIRFGSRCDIWIPLHFEPRVAVGDKVRGLLTVLASKK